MTLTLATFAALTQRAAAGAPRRAARALVAHTDATPPWLTDAVARLVDFADLDAGHVEAFDRRGWPAPVRLPGGERIWLAPLDNRFVLRGTVVSLMGLYMLAHAVRELVLHDEEVLDGLEADSGDRERGDRRGADRLRAYRGSTGAPGTRKHPPLRMGRPARRDRD